MKKWIALIAVICSSSTLFANVQYSPSQLETFEKTGSCPSCDLSSSTIIINSGIKPPYNLEGANISNSRYVISNNTLSNYSNINGIEANFRYNCYSQSSFRNAILIQADFGNANLTYTDFEGANVKDANFSDANLYGSKGINFATVKSVCNAIMPDGSYGKCN